MTTPVSICNQTLIRLGAEPITALTDDSDRAKTCNAVYETIRNALIAGHPWNVFTRKKELTRETETPVGKWSYSFIIPGEALRSPHAVYPSETAERTISDYEVFEGRRIHSDRERLFADYVIYKPEAEWFPWFTELMILELGSKIAFPITDQQSTQAEWAVAARGTPGEGGEGGYYATARTIDAQNSQLNGINADTFIEARYGSGLTFGDGSFV